MDPTFPAFQSTPDSMPGSAHVAACSQFPMANQPLGWFVAAQLPPCVRLGVGMCPPPGVMKRNDGQL